MPDPTLTALTTSKKGRALTGSGIRMQPSLDGRGAPLWSVSLFKVVPVQHRETL